MLRSFISYQTKKAINKLFLPKSPDGNSFENWPPSRAVSLQMECTSSAIISIYVMRLSQQQGFRLIL